CRAQILETHPPRAAPGDGHPSEGRGRGGPNSTIAAWLRRACCPVTLSGGGLVVGDTELRRCPSLLLELSGGKGSPPGLLAKGQLAASWRAFKPYRRLWRR